MDFWNSKGYFYPTLMIAFEIADIMQDFTPLISYVKRP